MVLGLREANQQFSKMIRAVRNGETVVLTDRGKPLAEIKYLGDPLEAREAKLVAEGRLIRPQRPGPWNPNGWKPIRVKGKPLSQTVIDDREDRF